MTYVPRTVTPKRFEKDDRGLTNRWWDDFEGPLWGSSGEGLFVYGMRLKPNGDPGHWHPYEAKALGPRHRLDVVRFPDQWEVGQVYDAIAARGADGEPGSDVRNVIRHLEGSKLALCQDGVGWFRVKFEKNGSRHYKRYSGSQMRSLISSVTSQMRNTQREKEWLHRNPTPTPEHRLPKVSATPPVIRRAGG